MQLTIFHMLHSFFLLLSNRTTFAVVHLLVLLL